jgi:hypothetical protein
MTYRTIQLTFALAVVISHAFAQSESNLQDGSASFRVDQEISFDQCNQLAADPTKILAALKLSTTDAAIIHYVVWKGINYTENWYAFDPSSKVFDTKRLYGRQTILVLAVHQNIDAAADVAYQVEVKRKLPSWAQNAIGLLTLGPTCRFGALKMTNVATPSDLVIKGSYSLEQEVKPSTSPASSSTPTPSGTPPPPSPPTSGGGLSSPPLAVPTGPAGSVSSAAKKLTFSETFDNEGRYWGDFSIGLPVLNKKVTDFQLTDGVLQRKEGARKGAYGFANLFFRRVDTKSEKALRGPMLLVGLPMTGQALDAPVVAAGFGFGKFGIKFDVYAGCVFNRTEQLSANTIDRDVRWVRKLTVGLNIPLGQFVSTYLKKK